MYDLEPSMHHIWVHMLELTSLHLLRQSGTKMQVNGIIAHLHYKL